ncbi:PE family protein [Mycobacterium ulcerans]|uniref:PE family protein n=1 Tax=Mycobacterium ulcerans TaxID=1809 RepID=UPI00106A2ED2|nr:PE family protein [Mycobacterium ulcerans]
MSHVTAQPEIVAGVALELQAINSVARAGDEVAVAPTTGVVPPAADLVSMLTAAQFAAHARVYQAISAQAAAVQDQLVTVLGISAGSYAATEAANTVAVS